MFHHRSTARLVAAKESDPQFQYTDETNMLAYTMNGVSHSFSEAMSNAERIGMAQGDLTTLIRQLKQPTLTKKDVDKLADLAVRARMRVDAEFRTSVAPSLLTTGGKYQMPYEKPFTRMALEPPKKATQAAKANAKLLGGIDTRTNQFRRLVRFQMETERYLQGVFDSSGLMQGHTISTARVREELVRRQDAYQDLAAQLQQMLMITTEPLRHSLGDEPGLDAASGHAALLGSAVDVEQRRRAASFQQALSGTGQFEPDAKNPRAKKKAKVEASSKAKVEASSRVSGPQSPSDDRRKSGGRSQSGQSKSDGGSKSASAAVANTPPASGRRQDGAGNSPASPVANGNKGRGGGRGSGGGREAGGGRGHDGRDKGSHSKHKGGGGGVKHPQPPSGSPPRQPQRQSPAAGGSPAGAGNGGGHRSSRKGKGKKRPKSDPRP